ncbi:MAG: AAA family ATPase [Aquificaceae bacterium]|nr:AAA family ATPase [Aquificaceae bacterium]MDW8097834.1 AAA family ATPase [Aquificaceae bacterium]
MIKLIRTKDYKRVLQKLQMSLQEENVETGTMYKMLVFGEGLEKIEGVIFNHDQFVRDLKDRREVLYVFRNFNPFSVDELVHIAEKYLLEGNPLRIVFLSPTMEVPPELEPYVDVEEDYFPSPEEVQGPPYVEGLTLAELKKINLLSLNPTEYREKILKKSGGVLELLKPTEVDAPIGLGEVLEVIKAMKGKGKGVLLMGVPGTGKTLIAKNLAKEDTVVRFNFSAVYSKYVGESERKLRETLKLIEQFGECYLFLDEFEKALATGQGDSGVSKRLLGEFLSWLEDRKAKQYLIATMNDLTHLPLELIRPGRWDFIFGLTPPPQYVRNQIVDYYARKYGLPFDTKLSETENITPADIATFYRVGAVVGLEKAETLIKLTKDLYPRFDEILEQVRRHSVPVWD